jgi:hypothetical protein
MLLVRTLYGMTKFMICYWSERCILRPSLWFLTGQNTVTTKFMICYWSKHYATTKFMICYWSEHYVMTKFMICCWSEHCMLWLSLWFVTGQNAVCYDQVYELLLVWEHCMLRPSLWFVTGQNAVCYDQVYDLLLFRTPYIMISNSYI